MKYCDDVLSEMAVDDLEIEYADILSGESNVGITKIETYTPARARRLVYDRDFVVSTVRTYLKVIAKVKLGCVNAIYSFKAKGILSNNTSHLFYHENLLDEITPRSAGVKYLGLQPSFFTL